MRNSMLVGLSLSFALVSFLCTAINAAAAPTVASERNQHKQIIFSLSENSVRRLSPSQIKAYQMMARGAQLCRRGLYTEAAKIFSAALVVEPNSIDGHMLLAMAYLKTGRVQAAADQFTFVLLRKRQPEALLALAGIYQKQGKLSQAVMLLTEVQLLCPNSKCAKPAAEMLKALEPELKREEDVIKNQISSNSQDDYFNFATGTHITKWSLDRFPIRVFIPSDAEATKTPHYRKEYGLALRDAFKDWSSKTNKAVTFDFVTDVARANIECGWASDPSHLHCPVELGEALVQNNYKGLTHVQVVILTFKNNHAMSTAEVKSVCLHEIGHALGISGHSTDPQDIMFHTMTSVANLTNRDCKTLSHLYRRDVAVVACTNPTTSTDPKALAMYGCQLITEEKFVEAIAALNNALRLDPNNSLARLGMAHCLSYQGFKSMTLSSYELAASQFSQALEMARVSPLCEKEMKRAIFTNYIIVLKKLERMDEVEQIKKQMATEIGITEESTRPVYLFSGAAQAARSLVDQNSIPQAPFSSGLSSPTFGAAGPIGSQPSITLTAPAMPRPAAANILPAPLASPAP